MGADRFPFFYFRRLNASSRCRYRVVYGILLLTYPYILFSLWPFNGAKEPQ